MSRLGSRSLGVATCSSGLGICRPKLVSFQSSCFVLIWVQILPTATLSSAEAPAGYPHQNIKISIIEKIESARGTMGRGKRLSFPFSPASPQLKEPPHNTKSLPTTQRGLCGGESYRQIGHFQSFGPMGVESNISWTELKDQDLGNWAVHNQQELQRVTTGTK